MEEFACVDKSVKALPFPVFYQRHNFFHVFLSLSLSVVLKGLFSVFQANDDSLFDVFVRERKRELWKSRPVQIDRKNENKREKKSDAEIGAIQSMLAHLCALNIDAAVHCML